MKTKLSKNLSLILITMSYTRTMGLIRKMIKEQLGIHRKNYEKQFKTKKSVNQSLKADNKSTAGIVCNL